MPPTSTPCMARGDRTQDGSHRRRCEGGQHGPCSRSSATATTTSGRCRCSHDGGGIRPPRVIARASVTGASNGRVRSSTTCDQAHGDAADERLLLRTPIRAPEVVLDHSAAAREENANRVLERSELDRGPPPRSTDEWPSVGPGRGSRRQVHRCESSGGESGGPLVGAALGVLAHLTPPVEGLPHAADVALPDRVFAVRVQRSEDGNGSTERRRRYVGCTSRASDAQAEVWSFQWPRDVHGLAWTDACDSGAEAAGSIPAGRAGAHCRPSTSA